MEKINFKGLIIIASIVVIVVAILGLIESYVGDGKVEDAINMREGQQEPAGVEEAKEVSEEDRIDEQLSQWIEKHTLEEKVAQMFMVTPEMLTGESQVTEAGDSIHQAIIDYPVGGIIYFADNLQNPEQTREMLENTIDYYEQEGIMSPFLSVDEEGGTVARIGKNSAFGVDSIPNMATIGATEDITQAAEVGTTISAYLNNLGFNMDMAPVADVLSNPNNTVIGTRSFGSDPEMVSDMVVAESNALMEGGIIPVIKHYPGHGDTAADSHNGYAYTDKSLDELMACELIPFINAENEGLDVIMVGHISVPNVTGDDLPSSISKYMINDLLREQIGYDGIVITDSMRMGAISQIYSSDEAAIMAINAGVDIILMPEDFQSAYKGVVEAVESGEISEERINESVARIIKLKYEQLK